MIISGITLAALGVIGIGFVIICLLIVMDNV